MSEAADNVLAFELQEEIDKRILDSFVRLFDAATYQPSGKEGQVVARLMNMPKVQQEIYRQALAAFTTFMRTEHQRKYPTGYTWTNTTGYPEYWK